LTYSCRNIFQIFLNFWHDVKKWHFDIHFDGFSSEVQPQRNPATSVWFYCYYRPPERQRSSAVPQSAMQCGTSHFLVLGCVESGGKKVLSWCPFSCYFEV
jgi:hypothetical protein